MKKFIPYIIATVILVFLSVLMILSARKKERKMDERITLRKSDKIPYGTYTAFNLLGSGFPGADISYSNETPLFWDSSLVDGNNNAVFFIARSFNADEDELRTILSFVQKGNSVFIIANTLSYEANKFINGFDRDNVFDDDFVKEDSLTISLLNPPFTNTSSFTYPGKRFESYFSSKDSS